ncbi:PREDICTED: NAC domain-containing protein 83-like [Prunus mume]|uniref:NAC domain-containing protein 83-like n=1 Tax=Prunus mume TaxID=102107 RepID=A0ABM0NNX1_PRUMU|nr:PREDICTED: NAC domain-containing protein 83-like [Prunus mume]
MADSDDRVGFRFRPTDQELITLFLYKMVVEKKALMATYDTIIRKFNIFGTEFEPSEIWNGFGGEQLHPHDQELYFFSELNTLSSKAGSRKINRKVGLGGGTWSGERCDAVYDEEGNEIGHKRKFRYENEGSEEHSGWFLEEYSLSGEGCAFDYVICRLRKNESNYFPDDNTMMINDIITLDDINTLDDTKMIFSEMEWPLPDLPQIADQNHVPLPASSVGADSVDGVIEACEPSNLVNDNQMGNNNSDEHQDQLLNNTDYCPHDTLIFLGDSDEEGYLINSPTIDDDMDELFPDLAGEWPLPQMPQIAATDESQVPFPTSEVGAESTNGEEMEAYCNPSHFQNMGNYQPLEEDINCFSNYSFVDELMGH